MSKLGSTNLESVDFSVAPWYEVSSTACGKLLDDGKIRVTETSYLMKPTTKVRGQRISAAQKH